MGVKYFGQYLSHKAEIFCRGYFNIYFGIFIICGLLSGTPLVLFSLTSLFELQLRSHLLEISFSPPRRG